MKLYKRRNALLHAKTPVIDGVWSTVGSTNMDFWRFSTNDEVNAVILSREFAMEMEKMFARDLAESDQVRWEDMEKETFAPQDQGVVFASVYPLVVDVPGPPLFFNPCGKKDHTLADEGTTK